MGPRFRLFVLTGLTLLFNAVGISQLTEVHTDDFRISQMGPDGDNNYDGVSPKVAYNSTNDKYLVVWSGDDTTGMLVEGEGEVFGQMLTSSGTFLGTRFRISEMGPDGDINFDAGAPSVAYNSADNEFMVVWFGDQSTGGMVNNEFEIFARRVDSCGLVIGVQMRISDLGPDGNGIFDAFAPEIVYNSTDNQYLVVWQGDDDTGLLVDNENEIFGQLLNASGGEIGANDFRISDVGLDGDASMDADDPCVTHNSIDNEYLVVWKGNLDPLPPINNKCDEEIFGQRLSANGVEVGTNDFRISQNFVDGNCQYDVDDPGLCYNVHNNEYLVVWQGQDRQVVIGGFTFQLAKEIFGQILDNTGTEIGPNDFRISDVGGDDGQMAGNEFEAAEPVCVYNTDAREYLVVFQAEDDIGGQVDKEVEIFVQRIDSLANELGQNDQRISDVGPIGNISFDASFPHIVYNTTSQEYLVVFKADDNTAPLVDNEFEIFGQYLRLGIGNTANNDCSQMNLNVTDALILGSGDNVYKATQTIVSDANLDNTFNNYLFQAPDFILLNPPFSVHVGVLFTIDMQDCVAPIKIETIHLE